MSLRQESTGVVDEDALINLTTQLHDLFKDATVAALRQKPSDLVEFLTNHFTRLRNETKRVRSAAAAVPFYVIVDDEQAAEPDREHFQPKNKRLVKHGWRDSVAGESYNPEVDDSDDNSTITEHNKPREQSRRLTETVKHILLFRSLDDELMSRVISAMFERKVEPGDYVIRQGDSGDNFYVIESGVYDVIMKRGSDAVGKCVSRLSGRGSFGELALMYNQPRTASVVAVTSGTLWAMDRHSFRRIVLRSAYRKRQMYNSLLKKVPMLQALDDYERATLADALRSQTYNDGACIVKEGDRPADGMYFIEKGAARVTITVSQGLGRLATEKTVRWLGVGDYFGETALLEDGPRTASVYAASTTGQDTDATELAVPSGVGSSGTGVGQVTVAFLERESFERLLGPCVDIMRRNTLSYTRSCSSSVSHIATISDDEL